MHSLGVRIAPTHIRWPSSDCQAEQCQPGFDHLALKYHRRDVSYRESQTGQLVEDRSEINAGQ